MPLEDEEISKQVERAFRKQGIKIMTEALVEKVSVVGNQCVLSVKDKKGVIVEMESDVVLSAVGVQTNIENIGLEEVGVHTERGKIIVDDYYRTNIEGIYAIGDIVHSALACCFSRSNSVCGKNCR